MNFRFAILAAVSSKAQAAADKTSLQDQVTICRKVGEKGWRETTGPYIVPGQSRTKYVNLRDAEVEIPPLREMLESARRGEFDILVMYDHDRLRDLLKLVYASLCDYGVQLYSYSLPQEPVPPDQFDPYESDTNEMLIGLSDIRSKIENSRIRRKYRVGMRNRILVHGLPVQIPFGYRRPLDQSYNRKAIPEPDPSIAARLIEIKDRLLRGHSIRQLIEYLNEVNLAPPKAAVWHPNTVRDILRNPFYAGFVRFEVSKVVKDKRYNRKSRNRKIPEDRIVQAQGVHKPIWDVKTHQMILAELRSRGHTYRGRQNNQLTGLLKCGDCGASLWRAKNGPRSVPDRLIWRCSQNPTEHAAIPNVELLDKVGNVLGSTLRSHLERRQVDPLTSDRIQTSQDDLEELKRQRQRLEDAYLRGLFPLETFERRVNAIDEQIAAAQGKSSQAKNAAAAREAWLKTIHATLGRDAHIIIPNWLRKHDPIEVNHILRILLDTIIVTRQNDDDHVVELRYRET